MFWPLASLRFRPPLYIGRDAWLGILPYAIPEAARKTHVYVIGKSGKGKSKFLESMIVKDIVAGRGVCVIDPHADLANDILANLLSNGYLADPQHDERVIYFEPKRADFVIPFNVLNLPYLPSHILADNIIEAFRRGWPETLREAPRFYDIALPSLRILAETGGTIVDLRKFLTNHAVRANLLTRVKDPQLAADFEREYHAYEAEELKNTESIRNKLTPFIYDVDLRRTLGNAANHLNFRTLMDRRKVLIVNLAGLSHGTQKLIGSLLTVGFEQAAFSRSEDARTPFYLYLDEFQRFCANAGSAETLANILSQCRKYGLRLVLAHQQVDQVQGDLISALGNVGVKVAFASEYEDARRLIRKFYIPDETGERPRLDSLIGSIQRLRERRALVKVDSRPLAAITTEPIRPYSASKDAVERLKLRLLTHHGLPALAPEAGLIVEKVVKGALPAAFEFWTAPNEQPPEELATPNTSNNPTGSEVCPSMSLVPL